MKKILLCLLACAMLATPTTAQAFSSTLYRHELLHKINHYRHEHGDPRLRWGYHLQRAARAHSIWMAANHTMEHGDWLTRLRSFGFTGSWAGENLAYGLWSPRTVFRAWRASPDHNANLLSPHYRRIGIGVVRGTYGSYPTNYVTADFGGR